VEKIRVLIAKPGLDGHDRGAKVIARALRDAGFEVIYTGLHQTPEMIVRTAVDEDVQVVGMSILSGAHNVLVPEVVSGLNKAGLNDALILVGGIIPEEDFDSLKKAGAHLIFTPGTRLDEIADAIRKNAPKRD
jgi:methylmalonyl-CoA mutase C-terminal domain/subunit